MPNGSDETLWREVVQRLTAIEENTKGIDDVSKKAQEAYSMACGNSEDIKELKEAQRSNKNWVMGIFATVIGYVIMNYFMK